MISQQETYDTVARHLRKQNAPSVRKYTHRGPEGMYRSPDGKMCAIGCLIPDDEYQEDLFESEYVNVLVEEYKCPSLLEHDLDLLMELQGVHDVTVEGDAAIWSVGDTFWEACKEGLLRVASDFKLNTKVLDALT